MPEAPADLLDRRLLIVTGKGGVGKTTTAAALALLAADRGKRTLVCELDAKGNLASFLECGPTKFEPREVSPQLFAMSMDSEESLKEYLSLQLRLPFLGRIGPIARIFEYVATAAPGVREILTIGKMVWEVRERHWDLIVVDAVASGHIIGQLSAPQSINELVSVGLIRQQTDWMVDLLGDPATTGLVITATPEEMPVNETIELAARLEDGDERRPRRRRRQPRAARVVRPARRGIVRRAERRRRVVTRSRAEVDGAVDNLMEAASLAVALASRQHRTPRAAARRTRPSRSRCCTCRTCSCAATACAPRAWSSAALAAELGY